ncbi:MULTISPECIES: nuclease-related domain-containing protein [unclassified Lacticaseibacillus]|uniref:nuclease-related domain-containing protein n=1 Tax=unclassified Lacticaseibacillus TaxID=2759744 RepID=UPI0019409994|nr:MULTISPECIES: nuclease-related domain-containing protein [unclassified Lacticaseibacillus]
MQERQYTNRGEYETYKMAKLLQTQYPEDGIKIYANLFLSLNDGEPNRQIDHLLLSHRGLFVLETKYWTGTIYHEITLDQLTEECADYWPIVKDSLPSTIRQLKHSDFFTLVARPDEALEGYANWHDPAQQVKTTMAKLHTFLKEHLEIPPFVHGFVLYAYPQSDENKIFDLNGRLDGDDDTKNDDAAEITGHTASEPDGFSSLARFRDYYEHMPKMVMQASRTTEIAKCIEEEIIN